MRRPRSVLIVLLTILCQASFAEVDMNLNLDSVVAVSTHQRESLQSLKNRFTSQIDYSKNSYRITAIIQLEHEMENGMQAILNNDANYTFASRPVTFGNHSKLSVRELYLSMPVLNGHFLTIGKQQVVWGKADGVKILDVVNPQSFNEFILEDFGQSRIPLWMVNLELSLGDDLFQILWIPDTSTHQLPVFESTYGFTAPRFSPPVPRDIPIQFKENEAPKTRFKNSDFGLRWSSFVGGWDIAVNYLYHFEDQPIFNTELLTHNATVLEITPEYYRSNLYGGSLSKPVGNITFRTEFAYKTDQRHYQQANELLVSDELSYVVGLDYFAWTDTLLSVQLIQQRLLDVKDETLFRAVNETSFSLLLRRSFWQETLTTEVLWQQNTNDNDGLVRPKIQYVYSDRLTLTAGLDIFYSDERGVYGQFADLDRLYLKARVSF